MDYPKADVNLSFRVSELTTINVSRDPETEFQHVVLQPRRPDDHEVSVHHDDGAGRA